MPPRCALTSATSTLPRPRSPYGSARPRPRPHVRSVPPQRLHSHDERPLADLPWAAYQVRRQLHVRKWFCRNRHCHRRIVTERLSTVAAPWARRTLRLAQRLVALGLALGGKAGVRLGHQWDLGVSRHTLLRQQPAFSAMKEDSHRGYKYSKVHSYKQDILSYRAHERKCPLVERSAPCTSLRR